jgi:hypothetical protein
MLGALGFASIVVVLHFVQPGYDGRRQLMSELALGPYGETMRLAFGLLALSLLGVQHGLRPLGTAVVPRVLLTAAAVALFAAGVFPLGPTSMLHIALVTLASGLLVAAMYLLPARAGRFGSGALRAECWLLAAATLLGAASANVGVPVGVAQRLAAACVLAWLCLVGGRLISGGLP